jgi:5-methylcytosine-specific restriction enzyme A
MMRTDSRSADAAAYRKLYATKRWKQTRQAQLAIQPLCERCLAMEIVEPATVAHHAAGGHKGNLEKFWFGPFESLCKPHHDSHGQLEDHGKKVIRFGADGWPIE